MHLNILQCLQSPHIYRSLLSLAMNTKLFHTHSSQLVRKQQTGKEVVFLRLSETIFQNFPSIISTLYHNEVKFYTNWLPGSYWSIGMKFGTGLHAFLRIFPTAFLCGLFKSQNHRSYSHAVFVCMQFLKYHSDLNKANRQTTPASQCMHALLSFPCWLCLSVLPGNWSMELNRGIKPENSVQHFATP